MAARPPLPEILPGDCLLYSGSSFVSWAIRYRTWSSVSHVEVYVGDGLSVTAKPPWVRRYPLDTSFRLRYVLRPTAPLDLEAGRVWFNEYAAGQEYHTAGLFRFFKLGKADPAKAICSEVCTGYYWACGLLVFAARMDPELISPAHFLTSPALRLIWEWKPGAAV